jgi:hypothetical protein
LRLASIANASNNCEISGALSTGSPLRLGDGIDLLVAKSIS